MSQVPLITEQQLKAVKRRAKQLSRDDKSRTYMQHLDDVCRDMLNGIDFKQAKKGVGEPTTPLAWYLQACQDAYFEI